MGGGYSTTIRQNDVGELLFERGDDTVAVEVHSATVDDETATVFTYTSDSTHRPVAINTIQVWAT